MSIRLLMFFVLAVVSASNIGGSAHEARIMAYEAAQQKQLVQKIQEADQSSLVKKQKDKKTKSVTRRPFLGALKAFFAYVCLSVAIASAGYISCIVGAYMLLTIGFGLPVVLPMNYFAAVGLGVCLPAVGVYWLVNSASQDFAGYEEIYSYDADLEVASVA